MTVTHDLTPADSPAFLAGGGEMGALIRAHDWSQLSIGVPTDWPQPLRTVVRLMLNTGHPMSIFWGEEGILFYNDALSRSLGPERHPGSLGKPAREVWADIWYIIGPEVDLVMSGTGSTWSENKLVPITRNGQREDVFWTYSYSPIGDDNATHGVGGMLVICAETTAQVLSEQRLVAQTQRQQQQFVQAPGFICILSGPDHLFEFVNKSYVRLAGDRQFVGRPVREVMPEMTGQGFIELLDQVYASGKRHVAENLPVRLRNAPGHDEVERYLDFIYEAILDENGSVTGIFVEGHDVTEMHVAQEAEQRQARHLKLLVDELNHRVKNTLAIVQGLARQTFRGDAATEDARDAFNGRLAVLASAHDVLTREHWEAADVEDIIRQSLDAHGATSHRFVIQGPPVRLQPQTAVTLAMVMHELCTNAAKYGALSNETGQVNVQWQREEDPVPRMQLQWQETHGPAVAPPGQGGFGTRMIRRALSAEPGGDVQLHFHEHGVVCEMTIALPALDALPQACST
ncbi:MAG: HWE histidine kinase domain-containing protein [Thermomonas sp.]